MIIKLSICHIGVIIKSYNIIQFYINAINIPDGNGGFVKYSLGGTPLPEYDGTVIIEKAESVLGLRRFIDTPDLSQSTDGNPYTVEVPFTSNNIECLGIFVITIGTISDTVTGEPLRLIAYIPTTYASEDDLIYVYSTLDTTSISATLPLIKGWQDEAYRTIALPDDTTNEWLLANTEGVSV